jgi:hypothetical protein
MMILDGRGALLSPPHKVGISALKRSPARDFKEKPSRAGMGALMALTPAHFEFVLPTPLKLMTQPYGKRIHGH